MTIKGLIFFEHYYEEESDYPEEHGMHPALEDISKHLNNVPIYKLEPAVFELSTGLSNQPKLDGNEANIASFLNTLSHNSESRFIAAAGAMHRILAVVFGMAPS